jgi:hypothetical protein
MLGIAGLFVVCVSFFMPDYYNENEGFAVVGG